MNGYKFADLAPGDSHTSPNTCSCCGREGLKRTVKLLSPAGVVVWFGVGCAAKACGVGTLAINRGEKAQKTSATQAASAMRQEMAREEQARWEAWLNANAGRGPIPEQVERLGGFSMAREAYRNSSK
jgi:hypothetical protein